MRTSIHPYTVSVFVAAIVNMAISTMAAPTVRIHAPSVMPRGAELGTYGPLVSFAYSNLKTEPYTLKVWLLEERDWEVASTQWNERTFTINSEESFANGRVQTTSYFDVYDYPSLNWVARLFDRSGTEVAMAQVRSKTVAAEAPRLTPVGKCVGVVGQEVRIKLSSTSASEDDVITYRMHDAPAGAKLDTEIGVLTWTPTDPGLYRVVLEAISTWSKLTDAEIVSLDIGQAEEKSDELVEIKEREND